MNRPAFSTIELVIALAVLSVTSSAAVMLVATSERFVIDSQLRFEALEIAKNEVDQLRRRASEDFAAVGSSIYERDGFQVSVSATQQSLVHKTLTVAVQWTNGLFANALELEGSVDDYNKTQREETCYSVPTSDWRQPNRAGEVLDLGNLVNDSGGVYPITDVDVYLNRLYVTTSNSSRNQPTFFVLDMSDPQSPSLVFKLDNDPIAHTGLQAVAVTDRYAYVASASSFSRGQLQIIDLNEQRVITTFKVPGVVGSSTQGVGESIVYRDGFIYLGLTKPVSGPDFVIIDVHDPEHPVYLGGFAAGHAMNGIVVRGDSAYVVTPNDEELKEISVVDRTQPIQKRGYNAPDTVGNGKSIVVVGPTLYLGRTITSRNAELVVLDREEMTPLAIAEIGSSVNELVVQDALVFVLTNREFQVWRRSGSELSLLGSPFVLPVSGSSEEPSFDCEGNTFFVGANDSTHRGSLVVLTGSL